MLKQRRRRGIQ